MDVYKHHLEAKVEEKLAVQDKEMLNELISHFSSLSQTLNCHLSIG